MVRAGSQGLMASLTSQTLCELRNLVFQVRLIVLTDIKETFRVKPVVVISEHFLLLFTFIHLFSPRISNLFISGEYRDVLILIENMFNPNSSIFRYF